MEHPSNTANYLHIYIYRKIGSILAPTLIPKNKPPTRVFVSSVCSRLSSGRQRLVFLYREFAVCTKRYTPQQATALGAHIQL